MAAREARAGGAKARVPAARSVLRQGSCEEALVNLHRRWVTRLTILAFGHDLTGGVDLDFANKIAVTVYPEYFQIYPGIGASLTLLARQ